MLRGLFQAFRNCFAVDFGAIRHYWRCLDDEFTIVAIVVRDYEPFNSQSLRKHGKHRCWQMYCLVQTLAGILAVKAAYRVLSGHETEIRIRT